MNTMKTIREIRRDNLIRLAQSYKSKRKFASDMGLAPAHMNQLLSGARDMGEEVARRIEDALGLTPGSISTEPGTNPLSLIKDELQGMPADELKLLSDYRRMSPRHQEMLRETATAYVKLERDP